jgi:hypothetical protein
MSNISTRISFTFGVLTDMIHVHSELLALLKTILTLEFSILEASLDKILPFVISVGNMHFSADFYPNNNDDIAS